LKRICSLLFLIALVLVSGCVTAQYNPYQGNLTYGYRMYSFDNVSSWRYNVTMAGGGTESSWIMAVNVSKDALNGERYFNVWTYGNGMNITYDVWSNVSTYAVTKMHARGYIGTYYQDRDVSELQIFTIPDVGLSYYYVPFIDAGTVKVKDKNGNETAARVYTATDNKGFTVTYWSLTSVPVPLRVEAKNSDFDIVSMLRDYSP
jgi:hypothetical protein